MNADKITATIESLMFPMAMLVFCSAMAWASIYRPRDPQSPRKSHSMSVVEFDGHTWVQGDWGSIAHHPDCKCQGAK